MEQERLATSDIAKIVVVLYVISWFLEIAVWDTYFWDDWLNYFNQTSSEIQNSSGPFSGVFPFMVTIQGYMAEYFPASFRIFALIAYPVAAVALWGCVKSFSRLTRVEGLALVSLFVMMPTNSARFSMTIFRYTSANMFFFLACYFFLRRRSFASRVLSLFLFTLSFDTASFFVFMLVPLGVSLLEAHDSGISPFGWLRKNVAFVIIGPAIWFIEPILNPTIDPVRLAYYTPTLSGVARGLLLGGFLMLLATYALVIRGWRYRSQRGAVQVVVGLTVCWLGIFPYMALGHFPNLNALIIGFVPGASDWDSRHQLLLPLGLAIILIGVVNLLNTFAVRPAALVLSVLFSILNLTYSQEYYLDSIKTTRIIEAFSLNPEIRVVKVALIDDLAQRFNARGRTIRSYEWDAMLLSANPDLHQKSDALRFVDCESLKPDSVITIQATNGKLQTLLTRDPGLVVSVKKIQPCSN